MEHVQSKDHPHWAGKDSNGKHGTTADSFSTRGCPSTTLLGAAGLRKLSF